jgi:hypothetical protein
VTANDAHAQATLMHERLPRMLEPVLRRVLLQMIANPRTSCDALLIVGDALEEAAHLAHPAQTYVASAALLREIAPSRAA